MQRTIGRGLELHWAREDLRDRAGLDRALLRERAKDTTLDYQAGFAERRGILAPDSEIIVSRTMECAPVPAREGEGRSRRTTSRRAYET